MLLLLLLTNYIISCEGHTESFTSSVYAQNLEKPGATVLQVDSNADLQVSIIIFKKSFGSYFNSYFQLTCIENNTLSIACSQRGCFSCWPSPRRILQVLQDGRGGGEGIGRQQPVVFG